jgi:acetylornithine deacetylase/succinyl-diaminopimelate desuccinylase-like protein
MRGRLGASIAGISSALRRFLARRKSSRARRGSAHRVEPYIDRLISDAIQFNETPSPTPREEQRAAFIARRLAELGFSDLQDEGEGNLCLRFPAAEATQKTILLFAAMENEDYSPLDSLVRLSSERAAGRGMTGGSLGVAALLALAEYLQASGTAFRRNLALLFTCLTGAGVAGSALERFLDRRTEEFGAAFHLTGTPLGAVVRDPLGTCRLAITVRTRDQEVLAGGGADSAVTLLSGIVHQLAGIRWDAADNTFLNVARLEAGAGYGQFASEGRLELEIFARDTGRLETSRDAVLATTHKITEKTGASIRIDTAGVLPAGDVELRRPLVEALRRVHARLGIRTRLVSRPDPAALLNARGIPALSLGLTTGAKGFREEYIDLSPLEAGFQQVLLLLEQIG